MYNLEDHLRDCGKTLMYASAAVFIGGIASVAGQDCRHHSYDTIESSRVQPDNNLQTLLDEVYTDDDWFHVYFEQNGDAIDPAYDYLEPDEFTLVAQFGTDTNPSIHLCVEDEYTQSECDFEGESVNYYEGSLPINTGSDYLTLSYYDFDDCIKVDAFTECYYHISYIDDFEIEDETKAVWQWEEIDSESIYFQIANAESTQSPRLDFERVE